VRNQSRDFSPLVRALLPGDPQRVCAPAHQFGSAIAHEFAESWIHLPNHLIGARPARISQDQRICLMTPRRGLPESTIRTRVPSGAQFREHELMKVGVLLAKVSPSRTRV
jgi:hypothetical protein